MLQTNLYGTPIPGFDICILPITFELRVGIFFFFARHTTQWFRKRCVTLKRKVRSEKKRSC